ncbi:MAG TPA: bifunctional YncE family protein/alkaline phosphatase family protein [Pirellulales bacterium]|nr:bifunctional YncE family protein/alkaline phosphatase family protein [Pirellulales bacterium]
MKPTLLGLMPFRQSAFAILGCSLTIATIAFPAAAQTPAGNRARDDDYDRAQVGRRQDGKIVVPTNQVLSPFGRQVAFAGRPTDLALGPGGRFLAVLGRDSVSVIDVEAGEVIQTVAHPSGSYKGLVYSPDGCTLYASNARGTIGAFDVAQDGRLKLRHSVKLRADRERNALPAGLAVSADGATLYAALNLNNTLAEIDPVQPRVKREFAVGSAPFDVVLVGSKAYVSNWAGRHPGEGDRSGPSGVGTRVRVDERQIASDGSVSVVDLEAGREVKQIVVGLHPSGLAASPDGRFVSVANANSDTVSVIDTRSDEVVETISTRPVEKLLFGSAPNALAFNGDGRKLFVANGTNNAVAVISFDPPRSELLGCFPTGWYPAGVVFDAARDALYVANIKGVGSRHAGWKGNRFVNKQVAFGYNSHDYLGTVSLVPPAAIADLAGPTRAVLANNRETAAKSALAPPRANAAPRPVPERHGEPSHFKHVLYVIKENRTYDQVLGDVERGEGDPALCIFGRDVTPNHHKLVDEFVLLDNFYCSGTLSADGHQWAMEAYVTDYIEKAYNGWPRSYPYDGGDALAYASSGFLWDNALAHGRSLRVYGEFVDATVRWKDPLRKGAPQFLDCYHDFVDGTGLIEVLAKARIETISPHICPTAIGFPGTVPDIHRADQFIRELAEYERQGNLPNLLIVLLPNDHTDGTKPKMPTPRACVADNDLALGRVVEAVSHSRFWNEMCIFVVEDDPQAGFDHIDGHRTVAMVASPYTRRRVVDSTNYNQTSMVRTIELVLGLPPMNQLDASATPMGSCFTDAPDFTPYDSVANLVPLDELNPEVTGIRDPAQLRWALASLELPLDDVDEADEDTLNHILWHAVRGRDDTYPAWAVSAEEEDEDEGDDD